MSVPCSRWPAPAVPATKLRPPRPLTETVARHGVDALLAAGGRAALTVVNAPAGFGKTMALAAWARRADRTVAWVSLDDGDDDARRLWELLLAALDRVAPGALDAAAHALHAGSELLETVVPLAGDALAQRRPRAMTIVVDDYHHVTQPLAHRTVDALLDALPRDVGLIVAGRGRPPLETVAAVDLGPGELRFGSGEVRELLHARAGIDLDPVRLATIEERVGGWPAGIAFVASALEAGGDAEAVHAALARAEHDMEDYLVEEVLDRIDPDVAELLMRLSILRRFDASLCETVAGLADARELLARAERDRLLCVDGDDPSRLYAFPRLFARLLREQLEIRRPHLVAGLHLRASGWYERAGRPEDAIRHANRAGDGARAAALLHDAAPALFAQARHAAIVRLVSEMPPRRGEHGPYAEVVQTVALQLEGGEPSLMYERWQRLERFRPAVGVAAILDWARVWPFFGRVGEAVAIGRAAYDRCVADDDPLQHPIAAQLALALWFAGDRAGAEALAERHAGAVRIPVARSWAHATLALCASDAGDHDRALRHAAAATGIALEHAGSDTVAFSIAYQAQADALRRAGRREEAAGVLDFVEGATSRLPASIHHALSVLLRAELHLAQGARAEARRAAADARSILRRFPDVGVLATRTAALERRADDDLAGTEPTRAELRVLELLAAGLPLTDIADALFVSINTVRSHCQRLYRRLGVGNRTDAIAAARRRGLVGGEPEDGGAG